MAHCVRVCVLFVTLSMLVGFNGIYIIKFSHVASKEKGVIPDNELF
jgi:NhaP-type Na+/H+ and K+/H+ antiporter